MTTELELLVWVGLLSILQAMPYTLALIGKVGLVKAASYPQPTLGDCPDWVARSKKSHGNLIENIAPFAIVVLVANAVGISNEATVMGAQIFFWSRVVMIIGHTAAVPFVRTLAWFASLAGLGMLVLQIL